MQLGMVGLGRMGANIVRHQFSHCHLARFHVGLIEGIDAEDRPGHRGRNLPPEELPTQVVRIGNRNPDHRLTGPFEEIKGRVL